jgi:hypothetical protein
LQTIIATVNNDVQAKLTELQQPPEKYQQLLDKKVQIIDGKVAEIKPIARLGQQDPSTKTRVIEPVEAVIARGAIVALQK